MAASSGKGLSNAATGGAPKEAVVTGSGLGFETTGWGVTAFFSSVASRLPPDEEGAASGAWLWLAGELEEMSLSAGASRDTKQEFYSQLLFYAKDRGYTDGWVAHSYKNKFGVWPKGMKDEVLPPSQFTLNWLRSRQISWAKSKKNT